MLVLLAQVGQIGGSRVVEGRVETRRDRRRLVVAAAEHVLGDLVDAGRIHPGVRERGDQVVENWRGAGRMI